MDKDIFFFNLMSEFLDEEYGEYLVIFIFNLEGSEELIDFVMFLRNKGIFYLKIKYLIVILNIMIRYLNVCVFVCF